MDTRAIEAAAVRSAILLPSLCVLLYTSSLEREGPRRRLPLLLEVSSGASLRAAKRNR